MFARGGAVLQGCGELGSRALDVAQPELGETEPEMKFVIFGRARHFAREERSCAAEVARFHGGEPAMEVVKRRLAPGARKPARGSRGFLGAAQPIEHQRE